jgi:hypothetical protein
MKSPRALVAHAAHSDQTPTAYLIACQYGHCEPHDSVLSLPTCGGRACVPSPVFPTSPPHRARWRGREPLRLHSAESQSQDHRPKIKISVRTRRSKTVGETRQPPGSAPSRPVSRFPHPLLLPSPETHGGRARATGQWKHQRGRAVRAPLKSVTRHLRDEERSLRPGMPRVGAPADLPPTRSVR